MLARPTATLPVAMAMPGGTRWEPKWDGYRGIVVRDGDLCRVWSRTGADLSSCFPDVVQAARDQLRPGTVIDGELVVWKSGRIDFTALAPRLAYRGSRVLPSTMAPATFLVFDVLALDGCDLRREPLHLRRRQLEGMATAWTPPLQLTPQTGDEGEARRWLEEYGATDLGVEGLVAKGAAQRYQAGHRGWLKYRLRHTREAIVGAVVGEVDYPVRLVLGLHDPRGKLRVAGATHPLSRDESAELGALLSRAADHPWPAELSARELGRFSRQPLAVTRVTPIVVVEVVADTAFEHGRWRHLTRYRRVRLDLDLSAH